MNNRFSCGSATSLLRCVKFQRQPWGNHESTVGSSCADRGLPRRRTSNFLRAQHLKGSEGVEDTAVESASTTVPEDARYVIDPTAPPNPDIEVVYEDGALVQRTEGMEFRIDSSGEWRIGPEEESTGVSVMAFPAGCTGNFATIQRTSAGRLYFGGQQLCSDPRTYPQYIRIQLRSSTGAAFATMINKTPRLRSAYSQDYTRLSTMYRFIECTSSTTRKYQQVVWPSARGVEFSPVVDRDEPKVACNFASLPGS